MNDQKLISKIEKAAAKKKSKPVIDAMKKADKEVTIKALEVLGSIGDEDSCNQITHYLDHEEDEIRITAVRAALKINTEYMKTRVRYQLMTEKNPQVKEQIQEAFNAARSI